MIKDSFGDAREIRADKLLAGLKLKNASEKDVKELFKKDVTGDTVIKRVETKSNMHAFNLYKNEFQARVVPSLL